MKKQPGRKSRYSSEYKAEAVRLCSVDGRSQNQIAKSLGINQTALNRWVRESQMASAPVAREATEELRALKEENRILRMEHEILKKAAAFFCQKPVVKYQFVEFHRHQYPVALQCKVLKVSSAGYYKWRSISYRDKELKDQSLLDLIQVLHKESFGAYGIRRIVRELRRQGIIVNQKRIRRLMKSLGIQGKNAPKKRYIATTDSNHINPVAENHLDREFVQQAPNKVWVSDITYVWTESGWLYLAVVIDLFSRMVVGWHTSSSITADLICMALEKAVAKRKPQPGLLLHSDRGVQYTSEQYRLMAGKCGVIQSMSRRGNCWDNAVAESFFRSLKVEALKGYIFHTHRHAESRIFKYIEDFYNTRRAHSFLHYLSPVKFEISGIQHRNSKKCRT